WWFKRYNYQSGLTQANDMPVARRQARRFLMMRDWKWVSWTTVWVTLREDPSGLRPRIGQGQVSPPAALARAPGRILFNCLSFRLANWSLVRGLGQGPGRKPSGSNSVFTYDHKNT